LRLTMIRKCFEVTTIRRSGRFTRLICREAVKEHEIQIIAI